ncbi:MAG: hypothetical protein IBX67_03185 [Dehalococcoidia bacterium]|nr:hypothetical protein [Dehalococcoidia bacterium]
MMEKEDFGQHVAQLVRDDGWDDLLALMHGIGLPAGWPEMVKPVFDGYLGKPVESSIIPATEIPEHQLVWLRKAPGDIQDGLEFAIKLSYEIVDSGHSEESGELVLPVIVIDHRWVLLLVGPDA